MNFGREVSYEYTTGGRRSKLTWLDGFYVTYGYDAYGRLNAVYNSNSSVLWSCSYDAAGRRTQTTGVYGLTTTYDYEDVSSTVEDEREIYLDGLSGYSGVRFFGNLDSLVDHGGLDDPESIRDINRGARDAARDILTIGGILRRSIGY
ncbi:MAG: hypothetical protein ACIAQZ_05385 [Sedimentisphaeraceae bacterium JB056]